MWTESIQVYAKPKSLNTKPWDYSYLLVPLIKDLKGANKEVWTNLKDFRLTKLRKSKIFPGIGESDLLAIRGENQEKHLFGICLIKEQGCQMVERERTEINNTDVERAFVK